MMNMARGCIAAALIAVFTSLSLAQAQDGYPNRPITLVVPFAAGGGADVAARLFAESAKSVLGQPITIENRAGAGGVVGAAYVSNAAPDGYTLLWANPSSLSTAQTVFKKLPYNPTESFSLISRAMIGNFVFVVNDKVPAKTVTELVEYAKKHPGKVNFGSAGVGSIPHLAMELFNVRSAAGMQHIPYKGSAGVYTGLMTGEIDLALVTMEYASTLQPDGRIRYVPLQKNEYERYFSDFADIEKPGAIAFPASTWYGLAGPAGLPEDVVKRLSDVIKKLSQDETFKNTAAKAHYAPFHEQSQDLKKVIQVEQGIWSKAAQLAGTKPQ